MVIDKIHMHVFFSKLGKTVTKVKMVINRIKCYEWLAKFMKGEFEDKIFSNRKSVKVVTGEIFGTMNLFTCRKKAKKNHSIVVRHLHDN